MKIKDIAVWGTVHEGRVLPVKVASKAASATIRPPTSGDADIAPLAVQHVVGLLSHKHAH